MSEKCVRSTIKVFSNSRRFVDKIHARMYAWQTTFGADVTGIYSNAEGHYFYAEADDYLLRHWAQENITRENYEIAK